MKQNLNFEIIDIYPNPVEGYFTFTLIGGKETKKNKLNVCIYNSDGSPIINKDYDNLISHSQYTIKTEELINGIYDVIFNINNVRVMQQIKVLKGKTKQ